MKNLNDMLSERLLSSNNEDKDLQKKIENYIKHNGGNRLLNILHKIMVNYRPPDAACLALADAIESYWCSDEYNRE